MGEVVKGSGNNDRKMTLCISGGRHSRQGCTRGWLQGMLQGERMRGWVTVGLG